MLDPDPVLVSQIPSGGCGVDVHELDRRPDIISEDITGGREIAHMVRILT